MDLREISSKLKLRHPWETARLVALRAILNRSKILAADLRVLDVGCGDAFTTANLTGGRDTCQVDSVDIFLSETQIEELSQMYPQINFNNNYSALREGYYNTIFLLDILEHVQKDEAFIHYIINNFAAADATFFITAPAFNAVFSSHDEKLGHFRRYNLAELERLINKAGLLCIYSGYLFSLLLPLRFLSSLIERITDDRGRGVGIGNWNHGVYLTRFVELILNIDNFVSLQLNRIGIKIPGLTVWLVCKKQL